MNDAITALALLSLPAAFAVGHILGQIKELKASTETLKRINRRNVW